VALPTFNTEHRVPKQGVPPATSGAGSKLGARHNIAEEFEVSVAFQRSDPGTRFVRHSEQLRSSRAGAQLSN
jgi:hypothetical protein